MKRQIIEIDPQKCNGCGECVDACHEGALALRDGKARLRSDSYCDGLGACLPECPTGAIRMVEKEAAAFDEVAVQSRDQNQPAPIGHSHAAGQQCPGSAMRQIDHQPGRIQPLPVPLFLTQTSELTTWPVQMKLLNPAAPYLENADLLIAADCTAFAYAGFHHDFIRSRVTIIACPKLDDNEYNTAKLAEIFANNAIHSILVVRMEVPCCGGLGAAVKKAMLTTSTIVPYNEVVVGIDGSIN